MNAASRPALYSPDLLALAVELADYPYDPTAPLQGEAHSRSCGSSILFSATPHNKGMQVKACAVGQASAAIFVSNCGGKPAEMLERTYRQTAAWLKDEGPMPDWPGIEVLEPARAYPGRHEAILLPWRAALDALSKGPVGR